MIFFSFFLHIIINRLWQEAMVTFNKDESLRSVQLVKALTTRQNADRQYY